MSTPPEIIAFVAGFPILLAHLGIGLLAFVVWAFVYTLCSRGQEISQIRDGNQGSAVLYGVTLMGLALPLARALTSANGWLDMAVWSGAAGQGQGQAQQGHPVEDRGALVAVADLADLLPAGAQGVDEGPDHEGCLLYTSPSPRD